MYTMYSSLLYILLFFLSKSNTNDNERREVKMANVENRILNAFFRKIGFSFRKWLLFLIEPQRNENDYLLNEEIKYNQANSNQKLFKQYLRSFN